MAEPALDHLAPLEAFANYLSVDGIVPLAELSSLVPQPMKA